MNSQITSENQKVGSSEISASLGYKAQIAEMKVRVCCKQLSEMGSKTLKLAKEAGQSLGELKLMIPHGEWKTYVEQQIGIRSRTASNYIRIAKNWDELTLHLEGKKETVSDFGIRDALTYFAKREGGPSVRSESEQDQILKKSGTSKTKKSPPTFKLADGSTLPSRCNEWSSVLFSREILEQELEEIAAKSGDAPEQIFVRKQRHVVAIVESINLVVGNTGDETSVRSAKEALETVVKMLPEPAQ
jgi:hypothetical protein